jgi:hypothetical protein
MTRLDILSNYEVNNAGVITSPGKFEGQMLYLPFFWDVFLNGFADDDNGNKITILISPEDIKMFPEIIGWRGCGKIMVQFRETDQGFVVEV